jgi:hypothetical protein
MQSVATLMQTVCMVTFVLYSICDISYFFVLLGAFRTKSCKKKNMEKLAYSGVNCTFTVLSCISCLLQSYSRLRNSSLCIMYLLECVSVSSNSF